MQYLCLKMNSDDNDFKSDLLKPKENMLALCFPYDPLNPHNAKYHQYNKIIKIWPIMILAPIPFVRK